MVFYNYLSEFEEAEEAGIITVNRTTSEKLNFLKLQAGRVDIFPVDREAGYAFLNTIFTPDEVAQFTHHPQPLYVDSLSMLLSKKVEKNERMLELFNRGLERLKASGKYDQYYAESRRGEYVLKKEE